MEKIEIKQINDVEEVRYLPQGVCAKLLQMKIKDDIILDAEYIGGCSGNLTGISTLVKGMNINEVVSKLSGIKCGNKPTSCPDQLTKAIEAYLESKNTVEATSIN